jgi:hypothetical protein
MKSHDAFLRAFNLIFWLTLPVLTVAYVLGWPTIVQDVIGTPFVVMAIAGRIVFADRVKWRARWHRLTRRSRAADQYWRDARKT